MIGQKVKHNVFGEGKVIRQDGDYVIVSFKNEEKRFKYPEAFKKFLVLSNDELMANIQTEIKIKEEKEINERKELTRKIIEEDKLQAEIKENKKKTKDKPLSNAAFNWDYSKVFSLPENQDLIVDGGFIQTGANKGKPVKNLKLQPNSMVFLTYKDKGEETRFVYGIFVIDKVVNQDEHTPSYVVAKSANKLLLTLEEANRIKFWNYYSNNKKPDVIKFGSTDNRPLDTLVSAQILKDIVTLKKGTDDESLALRIFDYFLKVNSFDKSKITLPNGALKRIIKVK
jgi:hypothetical protein